MARIASPVLSLALALGLAGGATSLAHAQQEVGSNGSLTAQQLMESLVSYGVWMSHPTFGWVWQPHDVQPWWQPFAEGEWIVTQDGSPYWRSAYPFGWATEHYGSWTYDDRRGWLWVPGREWSPAPVSWRAVDGVLGWAPQIANPTGTQASECPQPAFAWIFVATERVLTASNFEVAEKELLSRDLHGTWGAWAHSPTGVNAARVPMPRNANLLEVTKCLSATEAKSAFGAAARSRGITTNGPSINFVPRKSEMGSGRSTNGYLPVYAPSITGDAQPAGGTFMINPPAQPVQPVQMVTRIPSQAQPVAPVSPVSPASPAQPVVPAAPALPVQGVVPTAPVQPLTAYGYQRSLLNQYHAQMNDSLRRMHESDTTTPPYPGFDMSKLPAWRQREILEAQKEAERQRKLLEARQQDHAAHNGTKGNDATSAGNPTTANP